MLEQLHTPTDSAFVTLTYADENIPEGGSLDPADLVTYLNRIRGSGIGKVRFFAVGEYGDKTWRPHYHLALFGVPPEQFEKQISQAWLKDPKKDKETLKGFVQIGELNRASMRYVCGYTTKKMTIKDDSRLKGRHPEFSRMSKRPPLGAAGVRHLYDLLHTKSGCTALAMKQDAPSSFRIGNANYPIGPYWKNWLRKELGITNPPVETDWDIDLEAFEREQAKARKVATKLWRQKSKGFKSRRAL